MITNKVAIVTGSSRGIGAETARLLAKNGYSICINHVSDSNAADRVKDEILNEGGRCISVKADVSSPHEVASLTAWWPPQ